MKNLNHYISTTTYVFRQWSRKSYAVFNSLHRHVVIGCLGFDVHRSFYKSQIGGIKQLLETIAFLSLIKKVEELSVCLNKNSHTANATSFYNIFTNNTKAVL